MHILQTFVVFNWGARASAKCQIHGVSVDMMRLSFLFANLLGMMRPCLGC